MNKARASQLTIQTDKKTYKVGESIKVFVTNNGNRIYAALEGQSFCSWISIEAKSGVGFGVADYCSKSIMHSKFNVPILPLTTQGRPVVPKTINLNSGQTKYIFTFLDFEYGGSKALSPGTYRLKIYTWSYSDLIDKESLKSFTSSPFEIK